MPEFSCRKNLITGDHFPSDLIGSSSTRRPHWLVRLLEIRDDSECVGSLISETHVLTSGYCCAQKCEDDSTCGGEKFAAVLGDWNAATWTGLEQFGVTKAAHIHPEYNAWSFQNDICLIELEKPVKLKHNMRPICLPDSPQVRGPSVGNKCYVGSYDGDNDSYLQQTNLLSCDGTGFGTSHTCIGQSQGAPDDEFCHVNPGTGFICEDNSGNGVLTGIRSYPISTCSAIQATTDVSNYIGWLRDLIGAGNPII